MQYPLVLLFVSPSGGAPKQMMAYSGSRNQFRDLSKISKVFDLRDLEDLTQEWLDEKLKNFWEAIFHSYLSAFLTFFIFACIWSTESYCSLLTLIFRIIIEVLKYRKLKNGSMIYVILWTIHWRERERSESSCKAIFSSFLFSVQLSRSHSHERTWRSLDDPPISK